jgi:hexosaminidase
LHALTQAGCYHRRSLQTSLSFQVAAIASLALSTLFAQAPVSPDSANPLPLMPWPASITAQTGALVIDANFSVSSAGAGAKDPRVTAGIDRLFLRLTQQTGIPVLPREAPQGEATLDIVVEERDHRPPQRLGDDESYSLEVSGAHARISATKPLGALRGMETFLQLVQQNTNTPAAPAPAAPGFSVPAVTIHDNPRFPWRGLSLDVSRHFIPPADIMRTIDAMAAVKLNVLHWHLSDDQGFRMQSKRYPRLTAFGSDGQFYTQAQAREIVAYAWERGVRIVPEFDMPGHATSWLVGYPYLGSGKGPYQIVHSHGIETALIDPTKESTYRFIDRFIGEMVRIFPDEYFHIGGDEVNPREWMENPRIRRFMTRHHLTNAPALQAYFNRRVLKILTHYHRRMVGWDEVLNPDLPKTVVIQSWRGQQSLWEAARLGYQGILSAGYYLDLMYPASYHYAVDPLKAPPPAPGHQLKPGALPPGTPADLTPEQQQRILGGEGAMWEELATAENIDAKLWPRLAAIAERLWSPESITGTASMYNRLQATNEWLQLFGLKQRANLERMRERLAGRLPYQSLDRFASVLEPVKGYSRHAERYTSFTPLNRLVDSIPPESNAAREFRDAVDAYLAQPPARRNGDNLRQKLAAWQADVQAVRPELQTDSLLVEDIPVADSLEDLCKLGLQALSYLDAGSRQQPPPAWKQQAETAVQNDTAPKADILVRIAPGVQKLVDAVPAPGA